MISMENRESSSSSSSSRQIYDVFLSFRGADTRKNFTDHLYSALIQAGYHTFRDDDEIERGTQIDSELQKAIKQSRISIIILSKNYAYSRWCLNELSKILEYRKTARHDVLPIFYDVDPSQVRKQTGSYAEAFDAHEKRYNTEDEEMGTRNTVERWRAALKEVADIAGMELKNEADGHEAKFVQKILKLVGNKLKRTTLTVVPYPIGIDYRIRGISLWIDTSFDINILAICGPPGIGKTTIAKIVFNSNIEKFEGGSFLEDAGKTLEVPSSLIHLQRQFVSDIEGKDANICTVDEGFSEIKRIMCQMRVLLVIDDVNSIDHLIEFIGMADVLYPGSKIIVTTTNENLGNDRKIELHMVDKLQDDDSLRLFCLHAFRKDFPLEGYKEFASQVVRHCQGVPLALEILGSSLSRSTLDKWKKALRELEKIPNSHILCVLRVIGYDSLPNNHDKRLCLDIASFLVGRDKDDIVKVLEDGGFYPVDGIENLKDRCLIRIDQGNKLVMHSLIREMARDIIREEASDPGKLLHQNNLWLSKCKLIFIPIGIGLFFLSFMVFAPVFLEVAMKVEQNYICPFFHKGKDSWQCGTNF